MAIDILQIKPHEISRNLKGYTVVFYGQPKTGKTTTASKFPKALLLGFEIGYLALPNVMATPVTRWSEFKSILKQLKSDEAHAIYENIVVDTADICYDLCEKYVCQQNNVDKIGDIPYGGGYAQARREFDEALRSIPQMGYGLILISHAQDKTFKDENGQEYNQIVPTLGNSPRLVVDRMADIIGYAHPIQNEDGEVKTMLFMRGTPRFVAGSRFRFTPNVIEFNYQNLVNAIGEAIDAEAKANNGQFVTDEKANIYTEAKPDFDQLKQDFNTLIKKIQGATGSNFSTTWAPKIVEITNRVLGKGKRVSDLTPDQVELLEVCYNELVEQVGNGL